MKKVCLLVTLVLVVFAFSSVAEQIDLKSMSDDELIAMKDAISEEMIERGIEIDTVFYPGTYVCGVDIRPGVYYLYGRSDNMIFTVARYKTEENAKNGHNGDKAYVKHDETYRLDVKDGDVFVVDLLGMIGVIGIRTTKPVWAP